MLSALLLDEEEEEPDEDPEEAEGVEDGAAAVAWALVGAAAALPLELSAGESTDEMAPTKPPLGAAASAVVAAGSGAAAAEVCSAEGFASAGEVSSVEGFASDWAAGA
jgi:hypothetical protein